MNITALRLQDHAGFLFSNLRHCLSAQWPWELCDQGKIAGVVSVALAAGAISLVAEEAGETLGVSVCYPPAKDRRGEVVWCYVGYSYRRMGIGSKLCAPAGPAPEVVFYTRATIRIALEHGRELHWAGR